MTNHSSRALGYFPSDRETRIIELPVKRLEEDEILVRINRVAFTRRDRMLMDDPEAVTTEGGDFIIPGHIAVGKVVETGSLVRDIQPGDTVVPTVRRDCNRCIDGRSDLCPHPEHYRDSGLLGAHGFARDFLTIRSRYLIKLPAHLEHLALLLTPLSIAEKAHHEAVQVTKRFNFYCYHESQEVAPHALVVGMEPVGIMTVFLLSLYNYRLTVFSRRVLDDVRSGIFELLDLEYINTSRVPTERLEKEGYNFRQFFETTGDPDFIFRVIPFMAPNAVGVLMGAPDKSALNERLEIPAARLIARMVIGNQVLIGSIKAGRDAFESAVGHLSELADLYDSSLSGLFTHTFPLEEYQQLFGLSTRDTIIPVLEME
jgi:threonine dehydrogenase-like Zn-dependent dehydrogenase